jgi:Double-GTPase 1
MSQHSIVLLGGPDSGKTNYMSRLWLALNSKKAALMASQNPVDIKYVEGGAEYILGGAFAPRSDTSSLPGDLTLDIPVRLASDPDGKEVLISVPDVSGELWREAIARGDVTREWMNALQQASGALLFVRVLSEANVTPLDWVNAAEYLSWAGAGKPKDEQGQDVLVPTQVALCEMLRFLDETLLRVNGRPPRVAVLITAWDLVDGHRRPNGPDGYLKAEYPLFAGRLADCASLDVRTFGVSVVGGDFEDPEFTAKFQQGDIDEMGYVAVDAPENGPSEIQDVTLPVAWVVTPLFDDE